MKVLDNSFLFCPEPGSGECGGDLSGLNICMPCSRKEQREDRVQCLGWEWETNEI